MKGTAKRAGIETPKASAMRAGCLRLRKAFVVGAILSVGSWAAPLHAGEINGKVLRVADGDTILLQTANGRRQSVRIAGIDAPEPAQPYGRESRAYLARLLARGEVRADCPKSAGGKSVVCKIWARPTDCATCDPTVDVGLAQISGGMAWWQRRYALEQSEEDRGRYESEEQAARAGKRGLWADNAPVPPWDWRRAR